MNKKLLFFVVLFVLSGFTTSLFAKKTSDDFIAKAQKELPPQCMFFFKMYLNAKEHKAFAYAIDNKSKYTCRFSSSSKSEKKAKEVALASCKKSKDKRKIKSSCKIYEIDLEGFQSKKGLNFTKKYKDTLQKLQNELSRFKKPKEEKPKKSEKPKKIKKAKDTNKTKISKKKKPLKSKKHIKTSKKRDISSLPKPCHMFYSLYENAKSFKAFAIAIDSETKYVCKFSANSNTLKKAKEVAIASCQRSKKKRGVKDECKIFEAKRDQKRDQKDKSKKKIVKKKKAPKKPKRIRDPKLEDAILNTDLVTIKKLIRAGADVNVEANDKSRALFVAAAKGDVGFVKELLEKGADPYFKKGDGNNLLVAAIMSGKLEMLKLMLEQGIDPNAQCNDGNTPLHFAFMMFDDKMMKELYKNGAIDEIPNNKGQTVKDMAKEYNVNLAKLKR
jgi:hypothetical protein